MDLARGVGGNDVAGEDEVVEDPDVVGFFSRELDSSGLVEGEIFVEDLHCRIGVYDTGRERRKAGGVFLLLLSSSGGIPTLLWLELQRDKGL